MQSKRLLIVDDDRQVLSATARAARVRLGLDEANILTAVDGRAAARLIQAELDAGRKVDAVLSDFSMPEWNGVRLYKAIEARWPEIAKRFVMHSGEPDLPDPASLARKGVPVLDKMEAAAVLQAVRDALSR